MKKYDFIIVGQGIAGTLLARELLNRGCEIFIVNDSTSNISSTVGAGLYNPITGRKMVKTWMADEIFPSLQDFYSDLEKEVSANFHFPIPIYRPFISIEEQNDWTTRSSEISYKNFITNIDYASKKLTGVVDPFGGITLSYSGYVDIAALVKSFRKSFINKGIYREQVFQYQDLSLEKGQVSYQGIDARRIIFCDGPTAVQNSFWENLKFKPVKGELIDVECELSSNFIVNRGVFIIPKKGFFRVGSTYDHSDLRPVPSNSGIASIKDRLSKIIDKEYRIVNSFAGVRPSTFDRRPYLGLHKDFDEIGIFNGLGTKGVSLAPFFSKLMAEFLLDDVRLPKEVSVDR